jgi:diguanylate cyclase (GGDEF)-like protein
MLDLAHFKNVNDTHGHPAGDAVLRVAAARFGTELRTVDRLARFGGEEFAVLLVETTPAAAFETAQRLVGALRREPVALPDGTALPLTVSAGVAGLPAHASDALGLVRAADAALYSAKHRGRDRAALAL